ARLAALQRVKKSAGSSTLRTFMPLGPKKSRVWSSAINCITTPRNKSNSSMKLLPRLCLLRDLLAGAAEFCGKIFELRQPVPHRQHRFGVVDVNTRLEFQRRYRSRKDVDQSQWRVICHQMTPAFLAVLALAYWRFLEHSNMLGTG